VADAIFVPVAIGLGLWGGRRRRLAPRGQGRQQGVGDRGSDGGAVVEGRGFAETRRALRLPAQADVLGQS
jgi:hypothetical protein